MAELKVEIIIDVVDGISEDEALKIHDTIVGLMPLHDGVTTYMQMREDPNRAWKTLPTGRISS